MQILVVVVKTLEFCGLRILIGGFVTELKLFCRVFAKWAKGAGWQVKMTSQGVNEFLAYESPGKKSSEKWV